jgi:hypothetical protein
MRRFHWWGSQERHARMSVNMQGNDTLSKNIHMSRVNESVERMLQFKIFKVQIEKRWNILFLFQDYFLCFQEQFY